MHSVSDRIGRTGRAMLLAATGTLLLTGVVHAASPAPSVVVLPTTGVVDQVMAGYLADGISHAEADGAAAVIIELDTPGGDLFSTNDIVGSELSATIPVIVWVAPAGGFAASAGTFITLAGNIALMAPGTSIGAASPVGSGGTDITGTEGQKVTNDAAAKIQSIAETRGRNVDWARSTVLQAVSASATQAVSLHAVDGIAATLPDVLAFANGRSVTVGSSQVTLHLENATTTEIDMGPIQVLLHLLNDPNIAFVLFIIGGLGLVGELFHPNFFTGTVGAIALVLAFIGFGSLPLNIAGLILIALAIALFVAEAFVPSHALLAAGGLVCLVLGGGTLYAAPGSPTAPDVSVALPVLVAVVIGAGLYLIVVITAASRSRTMRLPAGTVGQRLAPGLQGEVRRPLAPEGSVYVGGEEWSARTVDQRPLPRGTPVRVVRQDGLVVLVEPVEAVPAG
ncbi:MAG TPA: nodulation protein NfeD [Candidatus Sulfotelmatobacter sp.]|nr:nodulation protein NfeD [Candidatus Sulfotelmatobacter sp.]